LLIGSGRWGCVKSETDAAIRGRLQTGFSDGSIAVADPKLAAFAIAGSLNWIAHWYRAGRKLTSDEVADAFVQLLEHGLAPRAPGEGKPVPAPARVRRPRPVDKR